MTLRFFSVYVRNLIGLPRSMNKVNKILRCSSGNSVMLSDTNSFGVCGLRNNYEGV